MHVAIEARMPGIFHGNMQRADDQFGALHVERVTNQSIDHFHQGGLNGLFAFDQRDGVQSRVGRTAHAAVGVLVKVAELLSAESRGLAADSGDFDMSARFWIWHRDPVHDFLVVAS